MNGRLCVFPDPQALAVAGADLFVASAQRAVAEHGRFTVALAGGATPHRLYQILARPVHGETIDWEKVHLFWGDERCVSPGHPDSNYRMVREALIDHVPIPAANVHRIRGEEPPEIAATIYASELRRHWEGYPPARFDLVLLGLGEDGHTASIFPGSAATHEMDRWVAGYNPSGVSTARVTLTPPLINAAREVAFLVSGAAKAGILKQVREGPFHPDRYPAQIVRPAAGVLNWLVDTDAVLLATGDDTHPDGKKSAPDPKKLP